MSENKIDRLMQASGFGSLLSEIVGCGFRPDSDLRERINQAANDNERYIRGLLSQQKVTP